MDTPPAFASPAGSETVSEEPQVGPGPGHVRAKELDNGFDSPCSDSTDDIPSINLLESPHTLSQFRQSQLVGLGFTSRATHDDEKQDVAFYSSASDSESQSPTKLKASRRKKAAEIATLSPPSSPSSPRSKKSLRRRSKAASDAASDRSHRSELNPGGGYTSTPATGKIFRNLLILEESLRQQVVQQRTLRRKYLTFLSVLCSLVASISYHLYFASSRGPLRVCLQLILLMLVVTLLLYHLSGEYQKTIVLPRKFLSSTNKGLRQLNVRLIKTKSTFTNKTTDLARELGLFLCIMALKFCHAISPSMTRNPRSRLEVWLVSVQSRCQPRFGLNDIKLVLVPRSFNTDIREGWELYRDEFWIKEGLRRRNYLLDFTRGGSDPEKRGLKKEKKEKRKRKSSVAQRPGLSEQNVESLDLLSPEASPPPS